MAIFTRTSACLVVALASGCAADTPPAQETSTPTTTTAASSADTPAPRENNTTSPSTPLAALPASSSALPLAAVPANVAAPLPRQRSVEQLLRDEVASWSKVPFRENGTTRSGIGNAQFVRAVYRGAYDATIDDSYDEQIRSGKLVARDALQPGDLLFFEGKGFGPFRSRAVGIFLGQGRFAIATKDTGVVTTTLSAEKWDEQFKTARRIAATPVEAPTFDAASYGSTGELLHEVAKAWSGTLYKQGGTTFDGIGNDEFVRSIYEAIYDTELEGTPKQWAVMGKAVKKTDLQPGDIILYTAVGLGSVINQRHAGMFIGDGEFVHSVKGGAVTISRMKEDRWAKAYVMARRIDPDALALAAERRAHPANTAPSTSSASIPRADMTSQERQLRDAVEPWKGTPYKLGGTSKSGVDCSALVRALYDDVYGVGLPRTAEEQERLGAKIERRNLVAGDLVFFRTQGMGPFFKSRHVGLYLGNGEFAQASGRLGVNVARLDSYYWNKKYEGARRLPKS